MPQMIPREAIDRRRKTMLGLQVGPALAVWVISAVLCLLTDAAQLGDKKLPQPDKAAQAKALDQIKEVHDYAKAASTAQKVALAKIMIRQAQETNDDPVGRFVLLEEARKLAAAGAEIQVSWNAIEALAADFDVDGLGLKAQSLLEIKLPTRLAQENRDLVDRSLRLMNEAAGEGRFDLAKQLAQNATSTARKLPNADLARSVSAASKDLDSRQRAYDAAQGALATLVKTPTDPDANLLAGRFYCFVKNDWQRGLPHLAQGSHATLKTLAERELAKPAPGPQEAALADGWWDIAQQEPEPNKSRIALHAGLWYERSMPVLKGFEKTKVERRMAVIGPVAIVAPTGPHAEPALTAPAADAENGLAKGLVAHWNLDEGTGEVVRDSSGNGHHGTLKKGPQWTKGRQGGALKFDGIDDFVALGNPKRLNFSGAITLAAWIKPTATDGPRNILAHGYVPSPRAETVLRVIDGTYAAITWSETPDEGVSLKIPAEDSDVWVHLAGVHDGTTWRLYRNGVEVATHDDPQGAVLVDADWAIGAKGGGNERHFQGDIDEVRIYNRGLSAEEIAALARVAGKR